MIKIQKIPSDHRRYFFALQAVNLSCLFPVKRAILSIERRNLASVQINDQGVVNHMSSSSIMNPSAREAMDRFKMEAASEVGVSLKQGYNGDLTSKQAGSIGGQMVKKMIESYESSMH